MQTIHRVSLWSDSRTVSELAKLGIAVRGSSHVMFEIDESDSRWPGVSEWMTKRRASDYVYTRFARDEIRAASRLQMLPTWHWSYPEPKSDSFGYLGFTYDLTAFCKTCGIGAVQKGPFMMAGEPKWGRRSILQLNWIFDEYFVRLEAWTRFFAACGLEKRSVVSRRGQELKTVVQNVVTSQVSIDTSELTGSVCPECARVKYLPTLEGQFPRLIEAPGAPIVKTREYFGSGASAHKAVIVARDLANTLLDGGVKGIDFRPVTE